MTMDTFYLVCFAVGLALSVPSFSEASGTASGTPSHGPLGTGHHGTGAHGAALGASPPSMASPSLRSSAGSGEPATCYIVQHLRRSTGCFLSVVSGVFGAGLLWAILFKLLLPRERVLNSEDTEMTGVLAKVSDSIRSNGGIGEILFLQTGARRCSAARSEDGRTIERGTEVVVIRYERGVA